VRSPQSNVRLASQPFRLAVEIGFAAVLFNFTIVTMFFRGPHSRSGFP
jgi:hypothetical protein